MFCSNCGKELNEGTRFCGGCGTPVASGQLATVAAPTNQGLTYEDLIRFQQAKDAKHQYDTAVQQAQEWQAAAQANYTQVKRRFDTCLGLGVIIAVATIIGFGAWALSPEEADVGSRALILFFGLFAAVIYAAIPFGFCPIIDFVKNCGFFIVFTWVFVAMLFAALVMFAAFAGIPCFFSQRSKVKKAETELNEATEYLNALAAA